MSNPGWPAKRERYIHADDDAKPQWDVSGASEPVDGVWDSTEWFPLSAPMRRATSCQRPGYSCVPERAVRWAHTGQEATCQMKDNMKPASFPGSNVVANGHGLLVMQYGDIDIKGHLGQSPVIPASWAATRRAASPPCSSKIPAPVILNPSISRASTSRWARSSMRRGKAHAEARAIAREPPGVARRRRFAARQLSGDCAGGPLHPGVLTAGLPLGHGV